MHGIKLGLQGGIDKAGVTDPFGIGLAQRGTGFGQLRIGAAHPLQLHIKLFGLGPCRVSAVVLRLRCRQFRTQMRRFIRKALFQSLDLFRQLDVDSALLRQILR